ncbi:transmembrane protein 74 isoform X2 [Lepidochelys kempii]|uniref:transmembrane protein 74 isoform X2 n=1 Tax=Lepidochelys kempii TaxID=8472 RepID=UPI003C6F9EC3
MQQSSAKWMQTEERAHRVTNQLQLLFSLSALGAGNKHDPAVILSTLRDLYGSLNGFSTSTTVVPQISIGFGRCHIICEKRRCTTECTLQGHAEEFLLKIRLWLTSWVHGERRRIQEASSL